MEKAEQKRMVLLYGSNYGSTASVAQRIGKILHEKGVLTDVVEINKRNRKIRINFDKYNGIILGSGIYAGNWTPSMKKFIKRNQTELKKILLAAFAVCGEAHNPTRIKIARKKYVDDVLLKWDIQPDYGAAFAGVLDLSQNSPYSKLELKIVRLINKKDPMVSLEQRNDYRNWKEIEKFADNLANLLPYIIESKKNQALTVEF